LKVSVDRIEEGIAVLVMHDDPYGLIHLPVSFLPPGCKEGDVLALTIKADPEGTAAARERISGLIKKLKKKEYSEI
jgi:hypothetical protein